VGRLSSDNLPPVNPPALYAAVDLGASSARVFSGTLDQGRLRTTEVVRLVNRPVRLPDGWHWDVLRIHQGVLEALATLSREADGQPLWAGFDGWGVDYGLLDSDGRLLGLPFCYRDERTSGFPQRALKLLGPGRIYEETGVQEMELNTLFQLMAESSSTAYALAGSRRQMPPPPSASTSGPALSPSLSSKASACGRTCSRPRLHPGNCSARS
jgi:rhamnulokinase